MVSERRGPSRKRFQAAVRVGTKIGYGGVFTTQEERDRVVQEAKAALAAGRDPKFLSEWDGASDREEIDDPWLIPSRRPTGERRLCAAMLLQAARDLATSEQGEAHLRSGARRWVTSRATSFGSFLFCVETLGRDAATTRDVMLLIGDAEKSNRVEGGEWQREPSAPLALVRRGMEQK